MGKNKRRSRNVEKVKIVPSKAVSDEVIGEEGVEESKVLVVFKDRSKCIHVEKGVRLENLEKNIVFGKVVRCEDCRESSVDRIESKGKSGKNGGKKGVVGAGKGVSKCIWVCLECGHFSCGGVGFPTSPQCHALRHSRQARHPYVVQLDNSQLRWCFPCNSLIPIKKSEDGVDCGDSITEAVKLIKKQLAGLVKVDVEGVNCMDLVTVAYGERKGGYVPRGLVNLGNTCFFNSVMQNLIAIDMFRNYFGNLDVGPSPSYYPLLSSLKKLFVEINSEASKSIRPTASFNSICNKFPQFKGFHQQDSHELLRFLLQGLVSEEKVLLSGEDGSTFVNSFFGGRLSSTVSCLTCNVSSVTYEECLDLSLPIPTKKPTSEKVPLASQSKKSKQPSKKEVKRVAKFRGKGKTEAVLMSSQCEPSPSEVNNSSDPTVSTATVKKENVAKDDNFSWMDYVGEDALSNSLPLNSQDVEIPISCGTQQDCENDEVFQNKVDLQKQIFLSYKKPIPEPSSCAGDVSSNLSQDKQSSQIILLLYTDEYYEDLPIGPETQQVYENGEAIQNNLDSQQPVYGPEPNPNLYFLEQETYVDVVPLQILVPEANSPLYKEANESTKEMDCNVGGVSSSAIAPLEDTAEFDGFVDLFTESEPISAQENGNGNGKRETGLPTENTSGSDPDEMDDTDAPMSLARCLAYFVKPEVLLANEQGWVCVACTKALQCQPVVVKHTVSKANLEGQVNTDHLESPNTSMDFDEVKDSTAGCRNWCSGKNESRKGSTATANCLVPQCERSIESNSTYSNGEFSLSDQSNPFLQEVPIPIITSGGGLSNASCSVNVTCSMRSNAQQPQDSTSQLSTRKQSNGSESVKSKSNGNGNVNAKGEVTRDATKRILIDKAPPFLTIHLIRFNQDARGRLSKIKGHVYFQDKLDLKPYMDLSCNDEGKFDYRLVGIVEHSGSMKFGHYFGYVRGVKKSGTIVNDVGKEEFRWFYVSDNHVREVSLSEVLESEAYILFYEKV